MIEPAAVDIDRVNEDLPCAECGYNLRTLALDASCPECGMSVLISARGDRLATAPADWLKRLKWGAKLLRYSVLFAFPVVYFGVVISWVGIWLLTAAQPKRVEPSFDRSYRMAARWTSLAGAIVLSIMTFGALFYVAYSDQRLAGNWNMRWRSAFGGGNSEFPMFDVLFLTAHAVYVLGLLSTWRYLQLLAQRVPDEALSSDWKKLTQYWIATAVGLALFSFAGFLLVRLNIVPGGSFSFILPIIYALVFAVVLTWLWWRTLKVAKRQVGVLEKQKM